MSRLAASVALALVLSGCRLLALGEQAPASVREGTPTATPALVPEALPDPVGAVAHPIGDRVPLGAAMVTYLGTVRGDAGQVSWFTIDGTLPSGTQLLSPGGERVDVIVDADRAHSEPWVGGGSMAGREMSLVGGGAIIAFVVGPITQGSGPLPSIEIPPPRR
jgi:hypothetical protein